MDANELRDDSKKKSDPLYLLKVVAVAGLAGFGFMAGVDTYSSAYCIVKALVVWLTR